MHEPGTDTDRAGTPEPILVRGPVQAVGAQGLKVAGRWFYPHPDEPVPPFKVGQLVCLETRAGHLERLTVLAETEPHRLGQLEEREAATPAITAVADDPALHI